MHVVVYGMPTAGVDLVAEALAEHPGVASGGRLQPHSSPPSEAAAETALQAFTLTSPRIGRLADAWSEAAHFVLVVRDPRAIWTEHQESEGPRTATQVAKAWTAYARSFDRFAAERPQRASVLRYEDLVASPATALRELGASLGLTDTSALERGVRERLAESDPGRALDGDAGKTTPAPATADAIDASDLWTLESYCHDGMVAHGYDKVTSSGFRFTDSELEFHRARLDRKQRYSLEEYAALVLPAVKRFPALTWDEATRPPTGTTLRPREIMLLRHDIDNDIENAVRLAHWEAEHGIRATYCVLHTAWYYRRSRPGTSDARSEQMVEACLEIQSLGHEINLHNNTIVQALRRRRDPYDLLAEELNFLRDRGLKVTGTSTHGDKLCGELGFQNLELFSETVYADRGGARTIEHEGHRVEVGTRSMRDFDLTYEGYDLPRDVYISDSGGTLRVVTDTAGRAGLHRSELPPADVPYDRVVGILTHPVWWNLGDTGGDARGELSFGSLTRGHLPRTWSWRRSRRGG